MKNKILFLAANPTTETWLALDEECRAIEATLRAATYRERLELVTKWAVRPSDLLQYFHEHKPCMIHFSGHGTKAGEIVLIGKNRTSKTVSRSALKYLFTILKDNIRVVVLNACYSKKQAKVISSVVDCCIGMSDAVLDDAAIVFAAAFYQAIGSNESVKKAFDCGIIAMGLDGISGKKAPKLLNRRGVDPDKVFVLRPHTSIAPEDVLAISAPLRKNSPLPCLVAKFQETNGGLSYIKKEIVMDLWIEGAPPETTTVAFEILDRTVRNPKWTERRKPPSKSVRQFLTDKKFHLYGDVEIWARGTGGVEGCWVVQSTLYEALCRHYDGREKSKEIRKGLRQIRTN